MRHGLDVVDLHNPQVRRPPVRLEPRIVIGTEMSGYALPMNGGVQHAADVGARDGAAMHADADEATRALVHDHEHPVAPEHDRLAAKEVHTPEAVGGLADERHPRGSGAARRRAIVFRQHARYTTCLSMSIPNVCEMMRAIRGQPNRGLGDVSSTMARMSVSSGPFGHAFSGTASMRTAGGTCDAPTPDETPGASRG